MKYIYLFILIFFSPIVFANKGQVAVYDFENGLDGWYIGNTSTKWQYSDTTPIGKLAPSGSKFIFINDNAAGSGANSEASAVSPVINLAGYSGVKIGGRFLFHTKEWITPTALFKLRAKRPDGTWGLIKAFTTNLENEWQDFEVAVPIEACIANQQFAFFYYDQGIWNLWAAIDDIYIDIPSTNVPIFATLKSPENNSINIPLSGILEWDRVNDISGYEIYAGTDNPPTTINGQDLGANTYFEYDGLEPNTTYYWKVVPYNEAGDAINCPVWSFKTLPTQWAGATISPLVFDVNVDPGGFNTKPITVNNLGSESVSINYRTHIQYNNKSFRKISTPNDINQISQNIDFPASFLPNPNPNHSNISDKEIEILRGTIGYANDNASNFISFNSETPATQTILSNITGTYLAADFIPNDGKVMYGINKTDNKLYRISIIDGTESEIGDCASPMEDGIWTDMACNKLTGIMYGSATNGTISKLYTIDLSTGGAKEVGELTGVPGAIAIAIDRSGDCYTYGIMLNKTSKVNLETGECTELGSTGFIGVYAQSMACDPQTNNIYLTSFAAINSQTVAQFRLLDKETGATSVIATLPNETYGFGYPGSVKNWLSLSAPTGNIPLNSSNDIDLNFSAVGWNDGIVKTATLTFSDENGIAYADDISVTMNVCDTSNIDDNIINSIVLYQNYPNPFNPETNIKFQLNKDMIISLNIYNSVGQFVTKLASGIYNSGIHSVNFDAKNLTTGIYYYCLKTNDKSISRKMLLVK